MRYLIAVFFVFVWPSALQAKEYGEVVVSSVSTIYDGDTFTVTIDSWPEIIGKSISVRVAGVDTPELRGKCRHEVELARKAKQFAVERIRAAEVIELKHIRRDKYFRILADVYLDGKSLGDQLMRADLAVAYEGKTKVDWCTRG